MFLANNCLNHNLKHKTDTIKYSLVTWVIRCLFVSTKFFDDNMGESPGLVVMGGDSYSEGRGFESQHRVLDGHFSHLLL